MAELVDVLFLLGRLLLGGFFVMTAVNHFTQREAMVGYAQMKGVPLAGLAVSATGLLLLAGGLSVITGILPAVGLALLALFLLGVTPKMHDFWAQSDPQARTTEQVMFLKNTALLGAVLALYVAGTSWPLSVGV